MIQTLAGVRKGYYPDENEDPFIDELGLPEPTTKSNLKPIETSATVPWYVEGMAGKAAPTIVAYASPSTVSYNGWTEVFGTAFDMPDDTEFDIYLRNVGETSQTLVATAALEDPRDDTAGLGEEDMPEYYFPTFSADTSTASDASATSSSRYAGDGDTLPTEKAVRVNVRADVSVGSSSYRIRSGTRVTLTCSVAPPELTGNVAFEYYYRGRWRTIATRSIVAARATCTWRPSPGTWRVRARYLGPAITNRSGRRAGAGSSAFS